MNVLLIISDQHQWKKLGCYGDPHIQTPNLDFLAERGVLFENAYCANPLCVPARTALLTGRSSIQTGVYSLGATFRDDMPTFAHLFAAAGYDTTLAGRMHFTWSDKLHGFHKRTDEEPHPNILCSRESWRQPLAKHEIYKNIQHSGQGLSMHDEYDQKVSESIEEFILSKSNSERNWMLTANFILPHEPYLTRKKYWDLYKNVDLNFPKPVGPINTAIHDMEQSFHQYKSFDQKQPQEEHIKNAVRAYYGLVTTMDERVGHIVQALERSGQLEDTIIIYTSDHGEMLGEKGCWHKSHLYESSTKVPMIVYAPKLFPKSKRISSPVSHLDLFPTFSAMLDLPMDQDIPCDGTNLLPIIEKDNELSRRVLCEYADYGVRTPRASLISSRYKLTYAESFKPVFIDLKNDPEENHNLIDDPEYTRIYRDFEKDLFEKWSPSRVREIVMERQASFELIAKAKGLI